jgi:hypothetical protein
VAALVELVVINQIGICFFSPTPRRLIELVRKDAHGNWKGNFFGITIAGLIYPIEAAR